MNVFTDFHHAGLLNSLIMLFEGRLGGAVYRPIGVDWSVNDYWAVYDHPATQAQFLGIGANTPDGTPPLNEVINKTGPFVYNCKDIESDTTNKAITFEGFCAMDFDIVIASVPQHVERFKKLIATHKKNAKLIYQIGNAWTVEAALAPNVMASAIINDVPEGINFIQYHQEFDLETFHPPVKGDPIRGSDLAWNFYDLETMPEENIYSFVNVFQTFPDFQMFEEVERRMPNWQFKSYGGQCRDGSANGTKEVAERMRESRFIWHTKAGGDGYGHVLYNTAAVGRPTINKASYYNGKMGQELLIDGETCINIDNLSIEEIVNKINYYSEPSRYAEMAKRVYANFQQKVDFDKEAEKIKQFLDNLI